MRQAYLLFDTIFQINKCMSWDAISSTTQGGVRQQIQAVKPGRATMIPQLMYKH
jgi:hypothetical protein